MQEDSSVSLSLGLNSQFGVSDSVELETKLSKTFCRTGSLTMGKE